MAKKLSKAVDFKEREAEMFRGEIPELRTLSDEGMFDIVGLSEFSSTKKATLMKHISQSFRVRGN